MLHPYPRYKTPAKRTHHPVATIAERAGKEPVLVRAGNKINVYFCVMQLEGPL